MHIPDRPNYEHPDMCGEDMTPDEELSRTEATCDYFDHDFPGTDPEMCVVPARPVPPFPTVEEQQAYWESQ